ncbi:zinc-binding alcohol dehydrogenase family protein [Stenotrophomonas sp. NLF4-10]|uniref:quinone oxidoreductase family protein n=1 Tax=Stenotrophomonas sp. NLF4-10 TaxID=2918754 RepID=UPI001EFB0BA7|nr:zinc-binding alcohol dehydrogenase family protein [Stenotrophomonas sp. NLF4-10]MCG8276945.1 zinc-binding alcohol dehydrogenase family protein [Stenotrophomonas sp. NLF4-10]
MKAAVVTSFNQPPHYGDFPDPTPNGPEEMLVEVLAVGLHHLTRGRASGVHYSSTGGFPLVAGVDGVGRDADGKLRYFAQSPGQIGTMADKTVIELDHSIELPSDSDPVTVAGAMNPAMASWLALRCRVPFQRGQKVLILGATGSSGSMAVQIARHLGASQVIAAGRDEQRLAKLPALGATEIVTLKDAQLGGGAVACEVDVVLDFLWGESSVRVMETVLRQRTDRSRPLTWIHVGSMAGEVAAIPGAFLRSANLQIVGSGHGSVSGRDILMELPALVKEIARGTFRIDVKATPLRDVEQVWSEASHTGERIVFTP